VEPQPETEPKAGDCSQQYTPSLLQRLEQSINAAAPQSFAIRDADFDDLVPGYSQYDD
jgi:hypothetical protein